MGWNILFFCDSAKELERLTNLVTSKLGAPVQSVLDLEVTFYCESVAHLEQVATAVHKKFGHPIPELPIEELPPTHTQEAISEDRPYQIVEINGKPTQIFGTQEKVSRWLERYNNQQKNLSNRYSPIGGGFQHR